VHYRKVKIGDAYIDALLMELTHKNLIVLNGRKGYVMCGYLDLKTAEACGDVAVKITGVSTIAAALRAKVYACTSKAIALGMQNGQPVREVLKIIA